MEQSSALAVVARAEGGNRLGQEMRLHLLTQGALGGGARSVRNWWLTLDLGKYLAKVTGTAVQSKSFAQSCVMQWAVGTRASALC